MVTIDKAGENLAKVLHYYGLIGSDEAEQKIICPFHEDVNPSMMVNLQDGKYYCFGCAENGNAQKFVRTMEQKLNGLNDLESEIKFRKILKTSQNLHLNFKRSKKYKNSEQTFLTMAEDYYYCLSKTNWFDKSDDVSEVANYMLGRGFKRSTLNLIGAKLTYNKQYPIIFPVLDNGEFKGYVCRTTSKEVEKKRKYLYNEGFSRATTVVGTYHSRTAVVVEGYMDMLKLIQFGEKNAVALFGWKATENQIEKLKKAGVSQLIVATDNDEYGIKGYNYLRKFFKTKRFYFPDNVKDIGEMTKEMYAKCKLRTCKR